MRHRRYITDSFLFDIFCRDSGVKNAYHSKFKVSFNSLLDLSNLTKSAFYVRFSRLVVELLLGKKPKTKSSANSLFNSFTVFFNSTDVSIFYDDSNKRTLVDLMAVYKSVLNAKSTLVIDIEGTIPTFFLNILGVSSFIVIGRSLKFVVILSGKSKTVSKRRDLLFMTLSNTLPLLVSNAKRFDIRW